jgi:hypothetical protein
LNAWSLAPLALMLSGQFLSGQCLAAPGGDTVQRVPFTFAPTRATLVLIPGAYAAQSLADHRPGTIDAASPAEAGLLRECAAGESQHTQTSKGFFWDIATTGWRVLLHPVAVAVRDELLKYSKVSEASASGDYYRADDPASPGGAAFLHSRISCLRFTRLTSAESGADQVALDFVASLQLDTPRDAIRLRPLRLYINQAAAKSADGHYSVAIAVRADAVWRDEIAGHSGQVFEQTVATESVDLKTGSFLKYYPTDAGSGSRVPIIPVSFGVDRSRDFGTARFAVSVAELGTAPQTLTVLAEMLPDPSQPLEKLLVAAALARAGLQ